MKKLIAAMLTVFVLLAFAACASDSGSPAQAPDPEPEPAPSYNVGEILQLTNYEFTVTDNVSFAARVETGGVVSHVFRPTREDRILAYVPVEITNISGERRRMLPSRLETPTQFTARLRYIGEDGSTSFMPIALSASVGDIIDRTINPGDTITGRVFFQIPPEIEDSTGDVIFVLRTNAGDIMGEFQVR